jgi:hypothetical protein
MEMVKHPHAMFDTDLLDCRLGEHDEDMGLTPPRGHKSTTILHLSKALRYELEGKDREEFVWIPEEFRTEIYSQMVEVSKIVDRILERNPSVNINHSKFICAPPGTMGSHGHQCKQTITFCYNFREANTNINTDGYFEMGTLAQTRHRVPFPSSDKFYAVMLNDPFHGVHSNEWKFWWFFDFTDYVEIPEIKNFKCWDSPYFNSENL